jgi:hypothetical protein
MASTCATCGHEHIEWPPGFGFDRPDAVFAMDAKARRKRVLDYDEYCCIDGERAFLHGVLELPVVGVPEPWAIDIWIEVDDATFRRFLDACLVDASGSAPFAGRIANAIDGFPDALGTLVDGAFGPPGQRPRLRVVGDDTSLGRAQHAGLRDDDLHAALAALGYEPG